MPIRFNPDITESAQEISDVDPDLFDMILESAYGYFLEDGEPIFGPTSESFFYIEARACEKLIRKVLKVSYTLFSVRKRKHMGALQPTALGKQLLESLQSEVAQSSVFLPLYEINPYLGVLLDTFRDWKSHYQDYQLKSGPIDDIEDTCHWLNAKVREMRDTCKSTDFRKRNQKFHHAANKNYRSVREYTNSLFDRYARLLVIRVDLWYTDVEIRKAGGGEYAQVKQDFERFIKNTKNNKIFRHKVGFITKLEHGTCRGFHFHTIFFYDGSKASHDVGIAKQIGEYWRKITSEKGHYWNCNAHPYMYRGIGQISHSATQLRHNLEKYVLAYVTKVDRFTRIILPDGDRALRRGVINGKRSPLGRPRKLASLSHSMPTDLKPV